jgi:hypothetical protein
VSIGADEKTTVPKAYNDGVVEWNELLEMDDLFLPVAEVSLFIPSLLFPHPLLLPAALSL